MSILINGTLFPDDAVTLHHSNRAFRYGDGFFESMVMFDGKVPLLSYHCERMKDAARALKFNLHPDLLEENLKPLIATLAAKEALVNARMRITVYRDAGGFYAPDSNASGYLTEWIPIPNNTFVWHQAGLQTAYYHEVKKPVSIVSNYKTCNALLYVLAGIYKDEIKADECFLFNENGNLCEGISSNFMWVKNTTLFTPPLNDGCVAGVMRQYVIDAMQRSGNPVSEIPCGIQDLQQADEVFFCSASRGIQWVRELKHDGTITKFSNDVSRNVYNLIMESLFH